MTKHSLIIAVALLVAVRCAGAATNDAPPDAGRRVQDALSVLARHGLVTDAAAAADAAVRAIVTRADALGQLLTVEEAERMLQERAGRVHDAGLQVAATNGQILITGVADGSGAASAGIAVGETIVSLDKGDVSALKASEVAELLRGSAGETLLLQIRGTNGATRDVEFARTPSFASAIAVAEDLPTKLGYLKLNGIYERSDKDVISSLRAWISAGVSGLVIDLRGAGGQDAAAAAAVASMFAREGDLIFTFRDAHDQDIAVHKARPGSGVECPTMVLVDGQTDGAAEALAAALAGSSQGAMLIGEPTRGDPLVRELIELGDDRRLYIATRRLVTADGTVYDGRAGVKPDLVASGMAQPDYEPAVSPANESKMLEEEKEDRLLRERVRSDPVLRRATDLLHGLKALNIGVPRGPEAAGR